jgi:predicted aldo/keto reductase-like oxidoreductase
MENPKRTIPRRAFLEKGFACAIGAGVGIAGAASASMGQTAASQGTSDEKKEKPQIKEHRKLGRTGWKVSDIAFGNAGMKDPILLEYAIERGINYVDTARQYFDMEVVVGKIFPRQRDKLFLTTKLMPELITADVSTEKIEEAIDESLTRLNTDYVDSCLIHSVGDPNLGDRTRIENPNIQEAFAKAKKAGKIKAWGASAHGPHMFRDFNWLIDNTDIDMIMPGMNYMTKGLEPILAKAKQNNIAVVAMKTLSAARKIDYSAYQGDGRTIRQALLKWMLAQPNIDTLSISMRSFEDVDEFVAASGRPALEHGELEVLQRYGMQLDHDYCRPGCDACLATCPSRVPIHDILRYRLYFNNYGQEKYAMNLYAALPEDKTVQQCVSCDAPCGGACPHGIAIPSKLAEAHSELTA